MLYDLSCDALCVRCGGRSGQIRGRAYVPARPSNAKPNGI